MLPILRYGAHVQELIPYGVSSTEHRIYVTWAVINFKNFRLLPWMYPWKHVISILEKPQILKLKFWKNADRVSIADLLKHKRRQE
jgi:hypothetical protein